MCCMYCTGFKINACPTQAQIASGKFSGSTCSTVKSIKFSAWNKQLYYLKYYLKILFKYYLLLLFKYYSQYYLKTQIIGIAVAMVQKNKCK